MQVSEIMTRSVATIDAEASLEQAAEEMSEMNIGLLPTIEQGRISGVVTDRDIVVRGIARHRDPARTRVREVMSANPVTVHDRDSVETAAQVLSRQKIGRVLVVDDSNRAVGIVSMGDMALKSSDPGLTGDMLRNVSERYQR